MEWLRNISLASAICLTLLATLFTGCGPSADTEQTNDGLVHFKLQLDWMPEAAHGGFYQAQLDGLYKQSGLDVEILTGGPSVQALHNVTLKTADFGIGRLDDIILAIDKGIPIVAVASFKQHDPQGVMVHYGDPAMSLADLDGRSVITLPGAAMILWLEKHYKIKLNIIPLDYGIQRFAQDKEMIQQCFVNSQPFYLEEMGIPVRTFLFSESGFDPGRVIYCNKSVLEKNPEAVHKFILSSLHGWNAYLYEDRSSADALLQELNPRNTPELNTFTVNVSKELNIFEGKPTLNLAPGALPDSRVKEILRILDELELTSETLTSDQIVPYDFLPPFVRIPDQTLIWRQPSTTN